MSKFKEKKS